jgi:hypothetical protein
LNKLGGHHHHHSNHSQVGWRTPEPKMRNPRVKILFDRWRKVWLLSMDRQRKLRDAIERLKEMERLKNFSFDEWRRRYMIWHKDNRARITDFFRRQDRDGDGKISREEFIQGILNSNFPSTRLELEAVADIFDVDKDGYIDYKEFLATLKPNTAQQPNVERIRDEVQRQVSLCKCSKRYHVLQISERHYRFGDSQKLRLVRILQSTVMVRVGGGWMALDEFLVKNDPCRAKGRTNLDLRESLQVPPMAIYGAGGSTSKGSASASKYGTSNTLTPSSNQSHSHHYNKSTCSTSRSGASSYGKRTTPHSSLSQSNEVLMIANNNNNNNTNNNNNNSNTSPLPSGTNSQSGSLGASISDLSSETCPSEFSDNFSVTQQTKLNTNANSSIPKPPLNGGNSNSSARKSSTSNVATSSASSISSRLPVPKKN